MTEANGRRSNHSSPLPPGALAAALTTVAAATVTVVVGTTATVGPVLAMVLGLATGAGATMLTGFFLYLVARGGERRDGGGALTVGSRTWDIPMAVKGQIRIQARGYAVSVYTLTYPWEHVAVFPDDDKGSPVPEGRAYGTRDEATTAAVRLAYQGMPWVRVYGPDGTRIHCHGTLPQSDPQP